MIYKLLLLELLHHRIALADALKEMPMTAEALAKEMPKIAKRLRHEAGIRVGDSPRSYAGVMKLFEKIPSTSKLETSEAKLRQFLADKHGSHVIPRSQGGTNAADNILWRVVTTSLSTVTPSPHLAPPTFVSTPLPVLSASTSRDLGSFILV